MNISIKYRGFIAVAMLAFFTVPAMAQEQTPKISEDEVRTEISQAMDAIANYTAQERDKALTQAREAMDKLDAKIEKREHELRENWAEMSEDAQKSARSSLQDLRKARNNLAERYGALESGASDAWNELKSGFADAWEAFSKAWDGAYKDPQIKD